jgi:hypothetical protein
MIAAMRTAKILTSILITVLLTPPGMVFADDGDPIEVRIAVADRSRLEELSRLVSIYNLRDGEAFAVVSPDQLEHLASAGFLWRSAAKVAVAEAIMCPAGWADDPSRTWDCYPSYGQYVTLLQDLAESHPTLCRLESVGATSNQSRPHDLWFMRISDNPDLEEAEPEVVLTSSMHGDEASGLVLTLRLIVELLEGYGADSQITELVDHIEIWINPSSNPDGTYFESDDTVDGSIRFLTTSGGANSWVEPNRNFPDPDEGDHPDGYPWWPETEAMMAFAAAHTTTLSANFHDGAEVVNYPWDTWSRRHVDDDLLIALSREYADRTQAASPPGYMTDLDNGITNGWNWYPVAGGRQDFMTFWHSDREVTIELSDRKTPPASELDDLWSWNRDALLGFIDRTLGGIHGTVTGPAGEPVEAVIELVGHDSVIDNSFVRTDPDVGDYHRLALPGSYSVRISAVGYETEQYDGVVVNNLPAALDVVLQPKLTTVTGRVRTPAFRRPVAGAVVAVVGAGQATTDDAGRFTIADVPVGERTVRISAENFETVEKTVTIIDDDDLELAIAPLHAHRYRAMTTVDRNK